MSASGSEGGATSGSGSSGGPTAGPSAGPSRTPMRAPTPRANDDFLARQERRERMKSIWKVISFLVFLGLAGWRLVVWVRDFGEAPPSARGRR